MTDVSEVRAVLQAARDLVRDPAHWCQWSAALDAAGCNCLVDDPAVVRRSLFGAVWCAEIRAGAVAVGSPAYAFMRGFTDPSNLSDYNNAHTHAEVLALLDQAMEAAT